MLKTRVIPVLLLRDVNLVKGPGFDSWRAVGAPLQAVKIFNRRDVDELILLDISATPESRGPDVARIAELAHEIFVPLMVGGGISTLDQIRDLLRAGADKVAINSAAYADPALIRAAADAFGSQCISVAIDYRTHEDGRRECFSHGGSVAQALDPCDWARRVEELGAGEILLTAIERDGLMSGYDLHTLREVAAAVSIPVIANGGASGFDDFAAAVASGASAVAAASLYLFTQATPREAKAHLAAAGVCVRRERQG